MGAFAASTPKEQPQYWLFSWVVRGGAHHFALLSESEHKAFLAMFPNVVSIKSVPELESRMKALPKGVTVGWGDSRCVGITYPSEAMMRQIEKFAEANRIRLLIIPGECQ